MSNDEAFIVVRCAIRAHSRPSPACPIIHSISNNDDAGKRGSFEVPTLPIISCIASHFMHTSRVACLAFVLFWFDIWEMDWDFPPAKFKNEEFEFEGI